MSIFLLPIHNYTHVGNNEKRYCYLPIFNNELNNLLSTHFKYLNIPKLKEVEGKLISTFIQEGRSLDNPVLTDFC